MYRVESGGLCKCLSNAGVFARDGIIVVVERTEVAAHDGARSSELHASEFGVVPAAREAGNSKGVPMGGVEGVRGC